MDMLDTTSNMCEFLRQKVSFEFVPKKRGDGVKRLDSRDPEGTVKRVVNVVTKPFIIGSLKITPLPVNHSLPGAMAYAIETSAGTVIYTGDFRFHGLGGELTEKFIEKAEKFNPVVIITEGTRIDESKVETEKEVYNTVTDFSKKSRALVIANFPVRDTDRMMTFLQAAKDNERRLVVDLRQAYLLSLLEKTNIAAPKLDDVDIYASRKSWGLITEDMDQELINGDYLPWERDFIYRKNSITSEEIKKNQKDYVWRCEFFQLKELMDVQPRKTSKYIWSVTEPFDIRMELNKQIIYNWLNHFNIKKIIHKHVSGHANGLDLKRTIETIKPKKIFPIHTEKPGKFRKMKPKSVMIRKGKEYKL
jgi:ribonuclease J